jgi:hypothetical protein
MGYFDDITTDRSSCAIYIGRETETDHLQKSLGACGHPLLREGMWPAPFSAALAVTGDIDCLTLGDFARRFRGG